MDGSFQLSDLFEQHVPLWTVWDLGERGFKSCLFGGNLRFE